MAEQVTPRAAVRDALDNARSAAQELHRAISGILAKRTTTAKAEVEGVIEKAKDAAASTKSAMAACHEAVKEQLMGAFEKLEAAQKHTAESLKNSREAVQKSGPAIGAAVLDTAALLMALADARASAQRLSEAVAARRSSQTPKQASAKQAS